VPVKPYAFDIYFGALLRAIDDQPPVGFPSGNTSLGMAGARAPYLP
jgi:hypothetical protein